MSLKETPRNNYSALKAAHDEGKTFHHSVLRSLATGITHEEVTTDLFPLSYREALMTTATNDEVKNLVDYITKGIDRTGKTAEDLQNIAKKALIQQYPQYGEEGSHIPLELGRYESEKFFIRPADPSIAQETKVEPLPSAKPLSQNGRGGGIASKFTM